VSDKHELDEFRGLNFNEKDSERREVGLLHYYKRLEECVTRCIFWR